MNPHLVPGPSRSVPAGLHSDSGVGGRNGKPMRNPGKPAILGPDTASAKTASKAGHFFSLPFLVKSPARTMTRRSAVT